MPDQQALKTEAVNRLGQILALSFGGMAAVRGGSHLLSQYPTQDSYLSHPTTTILPLKVPVRRNSPKQPDAFDQSLMKAAGPIADMGNAAGDHIGKLVEGLKSTGIGARDWLASKLPDINTTDPLMNTAGMPLMLMTGIGGAYGGLRAADAIAQKRQTSVVNDSLDNAKREYERELRSQFTNGIHGRKMAEEKQASNAIGDTLGAVGGTVATGLSLAALASAMGSYQLAKGHSQPRALQKAIEMRRRALQGQGPSLYAVADPVMDQQL